MFISYSYRVCVCVCVCVCVVKKKWFIGVSVWQTLLFSPPFTFSGYTHRRTLGFADSISSGDNEVSDCIYIYVCVCLEREMIAICPHKQTSFSYKFNPPKDIAGGAKTYIFSLHRTMKSDRDDEWWLWCVHAHESISTSFSYNFLGILCSFMPFLYNEMTAGRKTWPALCIHSTLSCARCCPIAPLLHVKRVCAALYTEPSIFALGVYAQMYMN